ncbi:MAG: AAA family ATPase [Anaerolineae bacterium]|nr:AAA family ATPase [Anaerolineae bacterium]
MIRRVFVSGYKSLGRVELELHPLTVIIGPNAAGKSNLFDALHLLSRIVTSRSLADAFSNHRGDPLEAFDYSEGGIQALLEKTEAEFSIEVDVGLSDEAIEQAERLIHAHRTGGQDNAESKPRRITERWIRYRVTVAISPRTGVLRVKDEYLAALAKKNDGQLRPSEHRLPFLERVGERLRLRIEGQSRPMEYETGLTYAVVSQPVHPPHHPHLIAFREEVSRWQFYYFEPSLMREESPVKEARQLSTFGGDLAAFYYTLKLAQPRQFDNLQRTLRSMISTVENIDAELTQEGKVRLKIRERGVDFSAKVISEGTLRILGLLAILSPTNPATVVSFEEPENGVHPRRLQLIAEMLRIASEHRQIIINTHSALLPDYLESSHLVRCHKDGGHSSFEPLTQAIGLLSKPAAEAALAETIPVSERILQGYFE